MRIGRRARRHVDKEPIQRLRLFRRRQQIDVVAGRDRIGLSGRQDLLVADHQRRLRPGWNEAAPEIQAFRAHGIADQLLLELAGQIELDAARRAIGARQRDMKPSGGCAQGPALQQQRDDHDDKGDVEIEIGLRKPDQHRDRGQKDRDRAAQAGPGDEYLLPPVEAKWREAEKHRDRPRHQHQHEPPRPRPERRCRPAAAARPAGRAARTSRSAPARSRRRETSRPNYARGSADCR